MKRRKLNPKNVFDIQSLPDVAFRRVLAALNDIICLNVGGTRNNRDFI
jgi:hypothetical protein